MRSVHWIFKVWATAWRWLGGNVTWTKCFIILFSNRK